VTLELFVEQVISDDQACQDARLPTVGKLPAESTPISLELPRIRETAAAHEALSAVPGDLSPPCTR
jgi:hypothetical protein